MNEENNRENREQNFANYFNLKKRQKEFDEGGVPIEVAKKPSRYGRYKEFMKGENQEMRKLADKMAGEEDNCKRCNIGYVPGDQLVSMDGGEKADDAGGDNAKATGKKAEESIFEVVLPEWLKGGSDLGKFTFRSMAKTGRTCLPCCAGPLAGAVLVLFTIIVIILWMFGIA